MVIEGRVSLAAAGSAAPGFGLLVLDRSQELGLSPQALRRVLGGANGGSPCRLPMHTVRRLWGEAERTSGSALGLRMAELLDVGDLGLLDYLIRSSRNWGDALQRFVRYVGILIDAGEFSLHIDRRTIRVRHRVEHGLRTFAELAWGLVVLRGCAFSGEAVRPRSVAFSQRGGMHRDFERVFQARVAFGAAYDELVFDREVAEIPFKTAEAPLCTILEESAESLLANVPPPTLVTPSTFMDQVRAALVACLEDGNPNLDRVAERLSLSPRSLQRYLSEERTSHRRLLQEARNQLLERHVSAGAPSHRELAKVLGYGSKRSVARRLRRRVH